MNLLGNIMRQPQKGGLLLSNFARRVWWLLVLTVLTLLSWTVPRVQAQEEELQLEFFYPLVTRRPVIEREVEFKAAYSKGEGERETEIALAVEWPVLPRWQIEVELPGVFLKPSGADLEAGLGDLEIENKVLLFKSIQYRTMLSMGAELKIPTGSSHRGLGGEFAIEPFLTAAIAVGPFDVLGEFAYEWLLNGDEHPREQELTGRLGVGYPLWHHLTPFMEVETLTETRGPAEEDSLRHKTQVYVVPGLNWRPRPGATVRIGAEVPVSAAKAFDYRLQGAIVWEF